MEERKAAGKPTSKGGYAEALWTLAHKDSAETAFARLETLQKLGIAEAYAAALASRFPERVTEWALQQPPEHRADLFWRIAHQLRSEGGSKAVAFAMKMPVDERTISIMREMAFEHLISHTEQVLPLYARIAPEEEAHKLMKQHAYAWLHGVSLTASDRAKRWLAETAIFTADEKQALSTPPAQRQ
jgi:acyl-CoA reductase-like NAD-dependent aldehyde dehydrogenase